MADDKKNAGPQDRSRINVHEDYEVRNWTEKFRVTEEAVMDAVSRFGVSSNAVAADLDRSF